MSPAEAARACVVPLAGRSERPPRRCSRSRATPCLTGRRARELDEPRGRRCRALSRPRRPRDSAGPRRAGSAGRRRSRRRRARRFRARSSRCYCGSPRRRRRASPSRGVGRRRRSRPPTLPGGRRARRRGGRATRRRRARGSTSDTQTPARGPTASPMPRSTGASRRHFDAAARGLAIERCQPFASGCLPTSGQSARMQAHSPSTTGCSWNGGRPASAYSIAAAAISLM